LTLRTIICVVFQDSDLAKAADAVTKCHEDWLKADTATDAVALQRLVDLSKAPLGTLQLRIRLARSAVANHTVKVTKKKSDQ
jgi:hypothetical protein